MAKELIQLKSISQLHQQLSLPEPAHPLISVINTADFEISADLIGYQVLSDFYMISMKDKSCGIDYGRKSFDFAEGLLVFSAPKQIITIQEEVRKGDIKGWMLYFHPDLIRGSHLQDEIKNLSFFHYEVYEALHLSATEESIINQCVRDIQNEYEQRIDNHSRRVLVSFINLLLSHSLRFYERQFNTRSSQNLDLVHSFQAELERYFELDLHFEYGTPSIAYFADKANLSQHYFSDLLKKESGRAAKDHINDYIIEKAKNHLINDKDSISEIAYNLGFNYPHYFTRLFKAKTGHTPLEFRNLN
jgi:AraC-like DNA-binding protein